MAELWPQGPLTLPHEFTLNGQPMIIPHIPTPTLLGWLRGGQWWQLFPYTIPDSDLTAISLRLLDDDDDLDWYHFHHVGTLLLGGLSGMALADGTSDGYWPARRLAATALNMWPVYSAWCATHGLSPVDRPLYEVMGSIYAWLRSTEGPDEVITLEQKIWEPPPYLAAVAPEALPQHVRDAEAAAALATLGEMLPGEQVDHEWTTNSPR